MLEYDPFIAVHFFFYCIVVELLVLFYIFAVTVTPEHRCVCTSACVCVSGCVDFAL